MVTATDKTLAEVTRMVHDGLLRPDHRSIRSGYVPTRNGSVVKRYKGRFGSGYIVITGIPGDTRRVSYNYYIENGGT